MKTFKEYLGDSVYAEYDGYHIILTTNNGYPDDPRNVICLDQSVLTAFKSYCRRLKDMLNEVSP